jgi:hypothetical protein
MARKTDTFFFIVSGYLFRESKNVDAFVAAAHEMELRMPMGGGEFFEVSDDGRRHRGRLLKGDTEEGKILRIYQIRRHTVLSVSW